MALLPKAKRASKEAPTRGLDKSWGRPTPQEISQHCRNGKLGEDNKSMSDKTKAQLERDVATLAARVAELEKAGKPPEPLKREPHQPFDPTANMGMPRSAVQAMVDAVPDSLVRDLHSDAARGNPVTAPTSQVPQRGGGVEIRRGSGWAEPNPLSPPPGLPIMDEMLDAQDRQDRADLQRRLARSVKSEH
jgi:hypothetical protein